MNENINIAKILKDAPNGLKLYSPLFGTVKLQKFNRIPAMIELNNSYPIRVETSSNGICDFDEYGRPAMYRNTECECMLFPSKENRDWSTFTATWKHKHFEPFQKVLVAINYFGAKIWCVDLYGHYDEMSHTHCLVGCSKVPDGEVIPFKGNEHKLGKPVNE